MKYAAFLDRAMILFAFILAFPAIVFAGADSPTISSFEVMLVIPILIVAVFLVYFRFASLKERLKTAENLLENLRNVEEEKNRLKKIIDTAPLAYVLTVDGMVVESNEYGKTHIGFAAQRHIDTFYASPDLRTDIIALADWQGVAEGHIVKLNMKNGEQHRFIVNIRKLGGEKDKSYFLWGIDIEANEQQKDNLLLAQRKTLEVSSRLERIINASPIYFIVVVDGKIVDANNTAQNNSKIRLGFRFRDLLVDSGERDMLVEDLRREGIIKNRVVRIKTSDKSVRRFLANIATADYEGRDAIVIWGVDIEEDESKKEELLAMRESLNVMLDSMPVALAMIDMEEATVLYANEACDKLFEVERRGETVGMKTSAFLPPKEYRNYADEQIEEYYHMDKPFSINANYYTLKGNLIEAHVTARPIEYNGKSARLEIIQDYAEVKALERAQKSLQTIFDTMPMPVGIVDIETERVVYRNERYLSLHEFDSPDDFLNCKADKLFASVQNDGRTANELMRQILSSEGPIMVDAQKITKHGNLLDLRMYSTPITYNGRKSNISILVDLTLEKEYKSARETLQKLLDVLPVPVRMLDLSSRMIIYVNKACAEMYEYEAMKDACVHISKTMPERQPDGMTTAEKLAQFDLIDETIHAEMVHRTKNGKLINVFLTSMKTDYYGRNVTVSILRDITAEKELRRLLVSAAQKEKEANQLKSRFLVNMSHEIRTPMNVIIGLTEIELRNELSRKTRDVYEKINTSAKTLLSIINDILDLSKIEADKIELYNEEFELEEVLGSAVLVAAPRLDGKMVELILNSSPELPRYLVGDRTRLWQVLKNVLDNSAKFTEEGRIMLTVNEEVSLSTDKTAYIGFVIEDTGIGMDEAQLQKMFQPYEQVRSDAQKRYTGTGLGMGISKQLCELMGGKLEISSSPNKGTSVRIGIPFLRADNVEKELEGFYDTGLAGARVLAVDDDENSLSIMSDIISRCGGLCETVSSGKEALEAIIRRSKEGGEFDIVLIDYVMDGLNGLETAEKIQTSLSKAPKLLMVTAFQRQILKDELEEYNIDEVIEKPLIPSRFVQRLRVALGLSEDTAEETEELVRFRDVHVLLCEDYALNHEVAAGMFAQYGISSTIAQNGREALDILASGKEFDLIFMDLQMPVMDGYEAAREIRAQKAFDKIPIISLTADAFREVAEGCRAAGMNDHIAKPIDFESLNKLFLKWIPPEKRANGKVRVEKGGLSRFSGNVQLYERALLEFSNELPVNWPAFDELSSNPEEARKYLHKIKGAAGNLSETGIYKYASKLEDSFKSGNPDKINYDNLVRESGIFKDKVALKISRAETSKVEGTEEEFRENIRKLAEALENFDLKRSSQAIEELKEKTWPGVPHNKLNKLYESMRDYDYLLAQDLVESFYMK